MNGMIVVIETWDLDLHFGSSNCSKPNVSRAASFSAADFTSWDSSINKTTSNTELAPFVTLTNILFTLKLGNIHWDLSLYYLLLKHLTDTLVELWTKYNEQFVFGGDFNHFDTSDIINTEQYHPVPYMRWCILG